MKNIIKNALSLTLLVSVSAAFAGEQLPTPSQVFAFEQALQEAGSSSLSQEGLPNTDEVGEYFMASKEADKAPFGFGLKIQQPAVTSPVVTSTVVAPVVADARWFGYLRDKASKAWNKASYENMKNSVIGMKDNAVAYYNNTTKTEKAIDTGKVAAKAGAAALVAYGTYQYGLKPLYNKYVKSTSDSTTPALAQSAPVVVRAPQPVVQAVAAVKAAPANIKRVAKKAVKRVKKTAKRGAKAVKRSARNVRRKIAGRRSAKLVVVRRSR